MKTTIILMAAFVAAGCTSMPRDELAWQAMHIIDVAQTANIVGEPCFAEADPLTARILGERPNSKGEVLAWGVGAALAHAGVTHLLDRYEAPTWIRKGWGAVSLGSKAATIGANHKEGVRMWGENVSYLQPGQPAANQERFPGCVGQ